MRPANTEDLESLVAQMRALEQQMVLLQAAVDRGQHLSALGVLAASVAHEFNNILTPIHGYAKAALARPEDSSLGLKALERVLAGAERGTAIARSVLALARGSDGGSGAVHETCVASAAVEAVALARAELDGSSVVARVEVSGDLLVRCEPAVLVQVFYNLLTNAARAMAGRGGHIRISATAVLVPHSSGKANSMQTYSESSVAIRVEDDGPGIAPGARAVLFKPLATSTLSHGTSARTSGSGLGLSICKGLLEASGGGLAVETVVGGGTTFTITLPLVESGAPPD